MDKLIFPPFIHKVIKENGKDSIFDIIRRKYIVLTPEEWVRQYLVHYLINHMNYPKSLIKIEDGLKVNKMQKRSDVVIFNRQGKVFMIIECKSSTSKLNQKVMDQLSIYNQKYQAQYLAITNGLSIILCKMDYDKKQAEFLDGFPDFA